MSNKLATRDEKKERLIHLDILGNKKYSLGIPREDEEIMRAAARLIEEVHDYYVATYDVEEIEKSGLRLMDLVAFQLALDYLIAKNRTDLLPVVTRIEELTSEVSEYLGKNNPL